MHALKTSIVNFIITRLSLTYYQLIIDYANR